jgi:NAD(P)-dependent dehydrogenase (short-subunit alcohol dehydrogenase family)
MTERLGGRVAIVTGAGQGVGEGIARALAAAGAAVVVAGRTAAKVETVAGSITASGGIALAVRADVGQRADVERLVSVAVETFGQVDILVNNAQDSVRKRLEDTTEDDLDRAYRTGPLASFRLMQACLPHLKVRGGSVVNLGSSTALSGDATFGSYAMAKEAIRALTRVGAREWGRYGIRVNTICPASMSPSAEEFGAAHPERWKEIIRQIPLGRMGDPFEDIGRAVVAIVGDDLRYLTGATLMLEGGRFMFA